MVTSLPTSPTTASPTTASSDDDPNSLDFSKLKLGDSPVRFMIDLESRQDTGNVSSEALLATMAQVQAVSAHSPDGKATSSLRLSGGGLLTVRVQPRSPTRVRPRVAIVYDSEVDGIDSDPESQHDRSCPPSAQSSPAKVIDRTRNLALNEPISPRVFRRDSRRRHDDDATVRQGAATRAAVAAVFAAAKAEMDALPALVAQQSVTAKRDDEVDSDSSDSESSPISPAASPVPLSPCDKDDSKHDFNFFPLGAPSIGNKWIGDKCYQLMSVVYPEGVRSDMYVRNVVIGDFKTRASSPRKNWAATQTSIFDIGLPTAWFKRFTSEFTAVCKDHTGSTVNTKARRHGDEVTWMTAQIPWSQNNKKDVSIPAGHDHLLAGRGGEIDILSLKKTHNNRHFIANVGFWLTREAVPLRALHHDAKYVYTPLFSLETIEFVGWVDAAAEPDTKSESK